MTFMALFQSDVRMYVGIGPFSDVDRASFPPDYFVADLEDDDLPILMDNLFVRLESDGVTLTVLEAWPTPAIAAPVVARPSLVNRLLRRT